MAELGKEQIEETKTYRQEKAQEILEQYKDLLEKYETVLDKDLLELEITKAGTEDENQENEQKFLTKLDARKKALEKMENILDRIENLEKNHLGIIEEKIGEEKKGTVTHPTKNRSRTS